MPLFYGVSKKYLRTQLSYFNERCHYKRNAGDQSNALLPIETLILHSNEWDGIFHRIMLSKMGDVHVSFYKNKIVSSLKSTGYCSF